MNFTPHKSLIFPGILKLLLAMLTSLVFVPHVLRCSTLPCVWIVNGDAGAKLERCWGRWMMAVLGQSRSNVGREVKNGAGVEVGAMLGGKGSNGDVGTKLW